MAHFNFVISQNAKWGHAGFYIDCHRMTVPENILLQKALVTVTCVILFYIYRVGQKWGHRSMTIILSNLNRFLKISLEDDSLVNL